MSNSKPKVSIPGIITLIFSLCMCILTPLVFHACQGMDGTVSTCHQAQVGVIICGITMSILSLIAIVFRNRSLRTVLILITAGVAIVTMLIPGVIMPLCMMPEMHCRQVMRPAVIIMGALIIISSLVWLISCRRSKQQ